MTENSEKSWNTELKEWVERSGKTHSQLCREYGLNPSTLGDYIHGRAKDLEKLSIKNKIALHKMTGFHYFKVDEKDYPPKLEEESKEKRIGDVIRRRNKKLDNYLEKITSDLSGIEKLKEGLLKYQRYKPTPEERADSIMEILDVLGEEVDYYRSASDNEKEILVKKLQEEPESFGYATQMLNILYSGKKIDSWMLMVEPPSKLKRLLKK